MMGNPGKCGSDTLKVLLTGYDGYIGSVMMPALQAAGHDVVGLDTFFFANHLNNHLRRDIRDGIGEEMEGFEAVIHLAALSNDPLGELDPQLTYEINHKASVRLAQAAKGAGLKRFLYASTCSVYGVANQEQLATEDFPLHPLSAYAISKVRVEEDLAKLADEEFSPVYLRNATAYGWSPNFRSDLVVNNLACWAYTTGEIRIMSDGTPWRPVVHIQDIARAFATALVAPREAIHNQAFNVGANSENYQVRELAEIVGKEFTGCKVTYWGKGGPDPRSYRVDFSKIRQSMPELRLEWNVRRGVKELHEAYQKVGLTQEDFNGPRYVRLAKLKQLVSDGQLDADLRWKKRVATQQG
jgi:nucleoside-diphosphate-sugar epimerase